MQKRNLLLYSITQHSSQPPACDKALFSNYKSGSERNLQVFDFPKTGFHRPKRLRLEILSPYLHPRGGTRSIHDGGVRRIFWVENLHARYFFGSRDLSRVFLGLKKIRVFFWVLSPSELFVSGFRCDQWIRKIFIRTFFQRRVFRKNC